MVNMGEIRICLQCSKEGTVNEIRPYQSSADGKVFCSLTCFQTYYKEHNSNSTIQSHELLSAAQMLSINADDLSFAQSIENLTDTEKLEKIEARILDLRRLQQKYKAAELLTQKRRMVVRGTQEADKVERYRKYGVNSDRELRNKGLSTIEKRIISYRKMNMNDDVLLQILVSTFKKFSEEEIKKIMGEVK